MSVAVQGEPFCDKHGDDGVEYDDCWACGGAGWFDSYEEDPLWHAPGETETCRECRGAGGWRVCGQCRDEASKPKRGEP